MPLHLVIVDVVRDVTHLSHIHRPPLGRRRRHVGIRSGKAAPSGAGAGAHRAGVARLRAVRQRADQRHRPRRAGRRRSRAPPSGSSTRPRSSSAPTRPTTPATTSPPPCRPGTYQVEVELTGFRKFVKTGVKLDAAAKVQVDAVLVAGRRRGGGHGVGRSRRRCRPTPARWRRRSRAKQIQDLMLNGRNPINLALLKPGVRGGPATLQQLPAGQPVRSGRLQHQRQPQRREPDHHRRRDRHPHALLGRHHRHRQRGHRRRRSRSSPPATCPSTAAPRAARSAS